MTASGITFAGERTAKAIPDSESLIPLPRSQNPSDDVTILVLAHPTIDIQLVAAAGDDFGIPIPAGHGLISLEGWRLSSGQIPSILKADSDAVVQVTVIT